MISASPHLYERTGKRRGVASEIIQRSLQQAREPERNRLPAVLTLRHLAHLTGVDYNYLRSIVSRHHDGYRPFLIHKNGGGKRLIAAPEPLLAATQKWINNRILLNLPVHQASQAYHRGASPIKCARHHLGARWLVKVDIHDFFESINERRVYFVFLSCGYQPLVAFELARLCTRVSTGASTQEARWQILRRRYPPGLSLYESKILGHLPQGAPTSPMLSNLSSFALDTLLQQVADRLRLVYTRYSDDMGFSTGAQFTRQLAVNLVNEVERILASFGHQLHRHKITIAPPGARKIVLGLLVDGDAPRLTKEFRSRVSDHVRGIEKFGVARHARERHFASLWGLVRHVMGLLTYAEAVDPAFSGPLRARLRLALTKEKWPSCT